MSWVISTRWLSVMLYLGRWYAAIGWAACNGSTGFKSIGRGG